MTPKEAGIVQVPSFVVVQHAPINAIVSCSISGNELHFVTFNPNIGVAFVHLLVSKEKKELEAVPSSIVAMVEEAKKLGIFQASKSDLKQGTRLLGSFESECLGSIDVEKTTGHSVCVIAHGELMKNIKKNKLQPTKVYIIAVTDGLR